MSYKYFLYFLRIFVGSLFIVSGLVKANDTLGFSYKLQEYFSPALLNLPFFIQYTLVFSIAFCVLEIVLGFAVIFGWYMRFTATILLFLTILFGFLTFYSAYFDVVHDCGCFGDALKGSIGRSLTPWESFSKDMLLLFAIIPLFASRKTINSSLIQEELYLLPFSLLFITVLSYVLDWYGLLFFTFIFFLLYFLIRRNKNIQFLGYFFIAILSCFFCYVTYAHLPIRDYLPYAIGKNIATEMKTCTDLNLPCTQKGFLYTIQNKQDKSQKKINDRSYLQEKMWENLDWELLPQTESVIYQIGYEPAITDFQFSDITGNSITASLLKAPKVFLWLVSDVSKVNTDSLLFEKMRLFFVGLTESKIPFYILSGSSAEDTQNFIQTYRLLVPIGLGDATLIKTMVRSNPGLMYLEHAKVVAKWHYNDFPSFTDFELQSYIAYERKANRWKLENELAQE
jgi:uncharacterized membrane protein YphA (DoxX/SURF4 family)